MQSKTRSRLSLMMLWILFRIYSRITIHNYKTYCLVFMSNVNFLQNKLVELLTYYHILNSQKKKIQKVIFWEESMNITSVVLPWQKALELVNSLHREVL